MVKPGDRPDPLVADVLPDSRMRARSKGSVGQVQTRMGMMEPIYCANCGAKGGLCPATNMTFMFWLCNPCFAKCGTLTLVHVTPDEVFWEKVKQEQLDVHGRLLAPAEIAQVVAEDTSALSRLIKAGS